MGAFLKLLLAGLITSGVKAISESKGSRPREGTESLDSRGRPEVFHNGVWYDKEYYEKEVKGR